MRVIAGYYAVSGNDAIGIAGNEKKGVSGCMKLECAPGLRKEGVTAGNELRASFVRSGLSSVCIQALVAKYYAFPMAGKLFALLAVIYSLPQAACQPEDRHFRDCIVNLTGKSNGICLFS